MKAFPRTFEKRERKKGRKTRDGYIHSSRPQQLRMKEERIGFLT